MKDETLDLLKKIKKLVSEGATPGEREAAQSRLETLMVKYGVSLEQLVDDDPEELHLMHIRLRNAAEFRLAVQVLGVATGKVKVNIRKARRGILIYTCTNFQHIEFSELLPHYLKAFREQQDDFIRMFIQANKLFPPEDPNDKEERPALTPEQVAQLMRQMRGAEALKKVPTPYKKLTG